MRLRDKRVRVMLVSLLFIFFTFVTLSNRDNNQVAFREYEKDFKDSERKFELEPSGFWILDPFVIDNDTSNGAGDYTWLEAEAQPWCSKVGDTYVIENLRINGNNVSNCLTIQDSDEKFIIQHSTFFNSSDLQYAGGIFLNNTSNGTINQNNCSYNNRNGIVILNGNNNTIYNNSLINNGIEGIKLFSSNYTKVGRNLILENDQYGISLDSSNSTILMGNIINRNNIGGVYESNSVGTFYQWNVINWTAPPISIDDAGGGDFTWDEAKTDLAWVSGSGILEDPYIIEDIQINGQNSSNCMEILNSNKYFLINNGTFYNASYDTDKAGIYLNNVSNGTITNSSIVYNNRNSIYAYNCRDLSVLGNIITQNSHHHYSLLFYKTNSSIIQNNTLHGFSSSCGIILDHDSYNNQVINNTLINCYTAMHLQRGSYNTFSQNHVYNFTDKGIDFANPGTEGYNNTISKNIIHNELGIGMGINLVYDGNIGNIIQENEIRGANRGINILGTEGTNRLDSNSIQDCVYGIWIDSCENQLISKNFVNSTSSYGILLMDSQYCDITHNNLIEVNGYSICVANSNYSLVSNNLIHDGNIAGINVQVCTQENVIYNNTIFNQNNGPGIYLFQSNLQNISRNTIYDNAGYGVYLESSNNSRIIGNIFTDNALGTVQTLNSYGNQIQWNSNNERITDPMIIDDNGGGDFTWSQTKMNLAWISGSGIQNDPYLIENVIFDGQNTTDALMIRDSFVYFKIYNCTFINGSSSTPRAGLRLSNADYGIIEKCSFIDNHYDGLRLEAAEYNRIINCTSLRSGSVGVRVESSHNNNFTDISTLNTSVNGFTLTNSNKNLLENINIRYNGDTGLVISSCSNNSILSCNINNNSGNGIYLLNSNNNSIRSCSIYNNSNYGIHLHNSNYSNFTYNNITNNLGNGIRHYESKYNKIIENKVVYNGKSNSPNIYIYHSDFILVSHNNISYNRHVNQNGLDITLCNNISVIYNFISYNTQKGIYEQASNGSYYYKNLIMGNDNSAVDIVSARYLKFIKNTITQNGDHALLIRGTSGCLYSDIQLNNITNNGGTGMYGLYLENSNASYIFGNRFVNNGNGWRFVSNSKNNTFLINYYQSAWSYIGIDNNGGDPESFYWEELRENFEWCTGSGTSVDPYIVEGITANGTYKRPGIAVSDSIDVHFIIRNCTIMNGSGAINPHFGGLLLYNAKNGKILDNNFTLNLGHGMYVYGGSSHLTISGNSFTYNEYSGIFLRYSEGNIITRNTANFNGENGVVLDNSNENSIIDNVESIINNTLCGIFLNNSHDNTITGNRICNSSIGILLNNSNHNSIHDNLFSGNGDDIIENNCEGNIFVAPVDDEEEEEDEGKPGNGKGQGPPDFVLILIFGVIVGAVALGGTFTVKKVSQKKRIPDKSLPQKKKFSSEKREALLRHSKPIRKHVPEKADSEKGQEIEEVTEGILTGEDLDKLPRIPNVSKAPKQHKKIKKTQKRKKGSHDEKYKELTPREKEELKETEKEVDIEKQSLICVVHKGPITGTMYVCPQCQTFYCQKCAVTLKNNGEKCWSCESNLNP